jgi:hypothetical protein
MIDVDADVVQLHRHLAQQLDPGPPPGHARPFGQALADAPKEARVARLAIEDRLGFERLQPLQPRDRRLARQVRANGQLAALQVAVLVGRGQCDRQRGVARLPPQFLDVVDAMLAAVVEVEVDHHHVRMPTLTGPFAHLVEQANASRLPYAQVECPRILGARTADPRLQGVRIVVGDQDARRIRPRRQWNIDEHPRRRQRCGRSPDRRADALQVLREHRLEGFPPARVMGVHRRLPGSPRGGAAT